MINIKLLDNLRQFIITIIIIIAIVFTQKILYLQLFRETNLIR